MESAYCSGEEFFSDCSENGTIGDEAEANGSEATKIITYDVDVAIIGNGPSAIFLSLLLSGYVPYFAGNLEDSVLGLKLEKDKRPIVEQVSTHGKKCRKDNYTKTHWFIWLQAVTKPIKRLASRNVVYNTALFFLLH